MNIADMTWRQLNEQLSDMSLDQVEDMLEDELNGRQRLTIANRLLERVNALARDEGRERIARLCSPKPRRG